MKREISVLLLEDLQSDAELITHELKKLHQDISVEWVNSRQSFKDAISKRKPDLIISDYTIPSFDGISALKIARAEAEGRPFIFVSGTIGEERAIDALKLGATDYVLKDNLNRLIPAVERALREASYLQEVKNAQEKIREQALFLNKAQDVIYAHDLDGHITYWNKSAHRLYGWKEPEVLGKNVIGLLYKQMSSQVSKAWESVFTKGKWMGELHHIKKDQSRVIVESRWTLISDEANKPKSILVINTDITEKKQLETRFMRAQRMENIGALAGGIAHDLNNILSPILMAVQILRQSRHEPKTDKMLNTIELSATRGAEIVKQILTFTRGKEGKRNVIQTKYLFKEIDQLISQTFPKSIQMKTTYPKNLWPIQADPTQLNQALLNLCVNARDAMPKGGLLEISAQNQTIQKEVTNFHPDAKEGSYVVLRISDTGNGIPEKYLDKIFEPFFTTKEFGKGTGLGLSTVRSIVQNHGGFITVRSKPGQNTTFEVYLPAHQVSDENPSIPSEEHLPRGNGELILVVDDEVFILDMLKHTLELFGYRVLTAKGGSKALEIYQRHASEIKGAIIDRYMPFMDGLETIRALQKINPDVKCIQISGAVENIEQEEQLPSAIISSIRKPYTTEKLLKSVQELIQND